MARIARGSVTITDIKDGVSNILLDWTGTQSWPTNTDINGAYEYTFNSDFSGIAQINFTAHDAEGTTGSGVRFSLNNGDEVPFFRTGPDNSTEDYTFTVSGIVRGENTLSFWSTDGDAGNIQKLKVALSAVEGARTVQGTLYYEDTTGSAPSAPSGNTYTFSTGIVSGSGISTGTDTDTWTNEPRPQDPTSDNTHYILKYYATESVATGLDTIAVNYGNVTQYTNFTGVVSFTDLSTQGSTTIHGDNILTGTIDADRINVENLAAISADIGDITAGSIDASSVTIENLQVGQLPSSVAFDADVDKARDIALDNASNENLVRVGTFTSDNYKGSWEGSIVDLANEPGAPTLDRYSHALKLSARDSYEDRHIPVNPGETIYFSGWFNTENTTQQVRFGYRRVNNGEAQNTWPTVLMLEGGNGWTWSYGSLVIPDQNTTAIIPFLQIAALEDFGSTYVNELRISRTAPISPKSLEDLDADANTKLVGIESGATKTGGEWFRIGNLSTTEWPEATDSTFNTVFETRTGRLPRYGDVALAVRTTGESKTFQYNGAWNEPAAVIRGDMLVRGTVTADRIDVIGSEATIKLDGNETTPLVIENITDGTYFKVATDGRIQASGGIFADGGVGFSKIRTADFEQYITERLEEVGTFTAGIDTGNITDTVNLTVTTDTVCATTQLATDVTHNIEFRLEDSWAHSLVDITETVANGGPTGDLTIQYILEGSADNSSWTSIDSGSVLADSVIIEGTSTNGGSTTQEEDYSSGQYEWIVDWTEEDDFGGGGYILTLFLRWNGTIVYQTGGFTSGTYQSSPLYNLTEVTVGEVTYQRGDYHSQTGGSAYGSRQYGITRIGQSEITNGLETYTLSLIRSLSLASGSNYGYYRAKLTGFDNTDTFTGTTPTGGGSGAIAFDGQPSLRIYSPGSSSIFSASDISVTTATASGGGSLTYDDAGTFTFTPANVPSLTGYATEGYVDTAISDLVDSSPDALNTLNELAAALGDDPNFATTVTNSIGTKASKSGDTFTGTVIYQGRSTDSGGTSAYTTNNAKLTEYMSNVATEYHSGSEGEPVTIYFKSGVNAPSDFAYITFDPKRDASSERAELVIGCQNDGNATSGVDRVKIASPLVIDSDLFSSDHTNIVEFDFAGVNKGYITTGGNLQLDGTITASGYNNSNWDTAYGWGDHSTQGYLTSLPSHNHDDRYYTESEADNRFVNVTGNTMTGALSLTTAATHPSSTTPTALSYGKLSGYGTFYINADTDGSTTEYLYLTSGYAAGTGGNSGLRIGYSETSLEWKGYRVFTDNYHPNADKWTTARTLSLTGDVTGSVSWDGSANASITTTVANDSHSHSNYLPLSGGELTGNLSFSGANNRAIVFKSIASAGTEQAFIRYISNSSFTGTGDEEGRMTIGVSNDFEITDTHFDAMDLQGGTKLTYNVGDWDAELDAIIGAPNTLTSSGNVFGHYWRIHNTDKMILDEGGNLTIGAQGLANKYYIRRPSEAIPSGYFGYHSTNNSDFGLHNGSGGGSIQLNSNNGSLYFRNISTSTNVFEVTNAGSIKQNNTTIVDSSRNLTNIASATATGTVKGSVLESSYWKTKQLTGTGIGSSYDERVILLCPKIETNTAHYNLVDGKISAMKTGGNVCDTFDVFCHSVWNDTRATFTSRGQRNGHKLVEFNYDGIKWIGIKFSITANPYNYFLFQGQAYTNVSGNNGHQLKVISYYDIQSGGTVLNSEIYNSLVDYNGFSIEHKTTAGAHYFSDSIGSSDYVAINSGGIDIRSGGLEISGTTVINSDQNLVSIGSITNSGEIASGDRIRAGAYWFTTGGTAQLNSYVTSGETVLSGGTSNSDMFYIRRQGTGEYCWQTYNSGNSGDIHLQPYGGVVGIGNTDPQDRLHVTGTVRADTYKIGTTAVIDSGLNLTNIATINASDGVIGGGNGIGDGKFAVRGGDLLLDRGNELRWNTGSGSGEYIYSKTSSPYDVTIHSGSYDALQCPNTGQVRINYQGSQKFVTTSSGVSITGSLTASGNVTAYSDINLKDNITEIDNALEKVNAIRGVTYDRIDQDNARHAGVIAQEVEKVLPEVVHTDDDGIKSVAYGNMVGLLIEAIKEQQTQINELQAQINTLKGEK